MQLHPTSAPAHAAPAYQGIPAFTFQVKWRMFMFGLVCVVMLEICLITYAGLRIHGPPLAGSVARNSSAPDYSGTDGNPWIVIKGQLDVKKPAPPVVEDNITAERFLQDYDTVCLQTFLPFSQRPDVAFRHVFNAILKYRSAASGPVLVPNATDRGQAGGASNNSLQQSGYISTASDSDSNDTIISGSLPACPCVPETLVGPINVTLTVPQMGEMDLLHSELSPGGYWEPRDCEARHLTAVIMPFRDREEHLRILLHHLHPMLQRQKIAYRVFVIEQAFPEVFNKAAMMNVGFREAAALADFDCYVFHDVDMVPEDDRNFYTCTPLPRHVGSHCDKFDYKVPYLDIFGGVTAFTGKQFTAVNGFSNNFYGWGGEDDDMRRRIQAQSMDIVRFPGIVSRYTMIKHGPDMRNPYNSRSGISWKYRPEYYSKEGLSTLAYSLRLTEMRSLYTWILAELPPAPQGGFVYINRKTATSAAQRITASPLLSTCLLQFIVVLLMVLRFCGDL